MYNKHYPSILVTFLGRPEHFSGKNGAFWWSILVRKQKHNVQKPICDALVAVRHTRLLSSGTCGKTMNVRSAEKLQSAEKY